MKKIFGRSMMVMTIFIVSACVPKAGQPANDTSNTGEVMSGAIMTGDASMTGTDETQPTTMGEPTMINPTTSMVKREGKKIGGAHNGTIMIKEGVIMMNEGVMVGGSLTIDMTTIAVSDIPADDSSNASLVGHLTGADFFATAEHPEAMFLITSIDSTGFPTIIANGDMTIKGVTKPVSITLLANESMTQLTGSLEIDRTEFGVMYSSTKLLDTIKDKAIDDMFTLNFTLILDDTMSIIDGSGSMDSTIMPIDTVSGSMDDVNESGMSEDEAIKEVEKMLNEIE